MKIRFLSKAMIIFLFFIFGCTEQPSEMIKIQEDPVQTDNTPVLTKNAGFFEFLWYRLVSESDYSWDGAWGDIDSDGDIDLVVANIGKSRLYVNDGNGYFDNASLPDIEAASKDVELFDADGDGDLDMFFANDSERNRLYFNNGSGVFGDVTETHLPVEALPGDPTRDVEAGDIDNDGDVDLVLANYNMQIRVLINDSSGHFVEEENMPKVRYLTNSVKLSDIDEDGDKDIILANNGGVRIYINTLDGFTDDTDDRISVEMKNVLGVVFVNNNDMILGVSNSPMRYYENSFGVFTESFGKLPQEAIELNDIMVANFNSDDYGDILLATQWENRLFIYENGLYVDKSEEMLLDISEPTYGLAVFDADGDLKADIVAINYDQQNRLYLQQDDGRFLDKTMSDLPPDYDRNLDTMAGDVNNDGFLDVLLPDFGRDKVYLNDGFGHFTDVSLTNMEWVDIGEGDEVDISCDATLGDLNADGFLDLFITNFNFQPDRLLLNNGNGSFRDVSSTNMPPDANSAHDAELSDMDNDGDIDIVVPNDQNGPTSIFLNDGNAFFTDVTGIAIPVSEDRSFAGRTGDFDNDGDIDIVVSNSKMQTRVYLNRLIEKGFLLFEEVTSTNVPEDADIDSRDVSIGDVDGDGDIDMILGNFGERTQLYLNNGSAVFTDATETNMPDDTGSITARSQLADFDSDGDLDIFISNEGQNGLMLNNGAGIFTDVTQTHLPEDSDDSNGSDIGDFNNDGFMDIIVSNQDQQNRIYFNKGK